MFLPRLTVLFEYLQELFLFFHVQTVFRIAVNQTMQFSVLKKYILYRTIHFYFEIMNIIIINNNVFSIVFKKTLNIII